MQYAFDALLVWGNVEDYKHFLPRLFDLLFLAHPSLLGEVNPEIIFSKLRHGRWQTWPAEEQRAIRNMFGRAWQAALAEPFSEETYPDLEVWLCCIAQAEEDLSPYLATWITTPGDAANHQLSSLLIRGISERADAFWGDRKAQFEQFLVWSQSAMVVAKLRFARDQAITAQDRLEFETALMTTN